MRTLAHHKTGATGQVLDRLDDAVEVLEALLTELREAVEREGEDDAESAR